MQVRSLLSVVLVVVAVVARAEESTPIPSGEPAPGLDVTESRPPPVEEAADDASVPNESAPSDEPLPFVEIPETSVVVTGTRTPRRVNDDPIGTERIGARELAARNVRDVSRAFEGEPGVQLDRSFRGSAIQLRGLDPKYVRILIDSMPIIGQVNDVIDLRRYGIEGVERIEIVRGATSALYGSDALGGVVNLISRRPRKPFEGSFFAQYAPPRELPVLGRMESTALGGTAGGRWGDLAASLAFNWYANDSYTLFPGNPSGLPTNGDARSTGAATGRVYWMPSSAFELSAFVRAGTVSSRGVDLMGAYDAEGNIEPGSSLWNRSVEERELAGGGIATWRPDEQTRIQLFAQGNAFLRDYHRRQRQRDNEDVQFSVERLGRAELQVDRWFGEAYSVTGGVGGQFGSFSSLRLAEGYSSLAQGWAFAQVEAQPLAWLDLVGGARLDVDELFGVHFTPRLAVRTKLDALVPGLSLRAAYGEGFRAPSFGERFLAFNNPAANYFVSGNPALRPETSRGGQAGIEWTPEWDRAGLVPSVRLTAHRTTLDGLIQAREIDGSTPGRPLYQYVNYDRAEIAGIEGSMRLAWADWLIGDLGYAWLDAKAFDENGARFLPGRAMRQVTATLLVMHDDSGFELSTRTQVLFGRVGMSSEGLRPIVLTDLKLGQRVWRPENGRGEVQLYAMGDNLWNVTEREFLQLPGLVVHAGISARY